MARLSPELQTYANDGLRLCREGEWNKGLAVLAAVLEQRSPVDEVPGVVYSYLGYGVARFQGKLREGQKLCEHALKIEFYEADNHWNLARVQALAGERMNAHNTIERGLKLDAAHEGLLATRAELGVRKRPVLGFLSRENPLNVLLGRIRHSLKATPNAPAQTTGERSVDRTGSRPRPQLRQPGNSVAATGSRPAPKTASPKSPTAR